MKIWRKYLANWYYCGLVLAALLGGVLVFFWNSLSILQRLSWLNLIGLLVHQFEEYGFPGGFPIIMNMGIRHSDIPDRYPLNQFSAFLVNVVVGYIMYSLPIIFPEAIWLGIPPIVFGLGQVIGHGFVFGRSYRSHYSPGLIACILFHLPIGILYLRYVIVNHMASAGIWLVGIGIDFFVAGFIFNFCVYRLMAHKDSKYPFTEKETARFHSAQRIEQASKREGKTHV